ncbi:MAG: hypothetical protein AUJ19_03930 [Parcubacteria group bacterium CG1_02_58_44]|nr:MAG: hypothetical protein AUJ19_03930 [Parcubacteria group bacterium CG1_02_58_44]
MGERLRQIGPEDTETPDDQARRQAEQLKRATRETSDLPMPASDEGEVELDESDLMETTEEEIASEKSRKADLQEHLRQEIKKTIDRSKARKTAAAQTERDRRAMKKIADEMQNRQVSGKTSDKARLQQVELKRQREAEEAERQAAENQRRESDLLNVREALKQADRAEEAAKKAQQIMDEIDVQERKTAGIIKGKEDFDREQAERQRLALLEALDRDEQAAAAEESERQRLAREKREGIIAGKEAFDREQARKKAEVDAEQSQIKGTEQWKQRRNESFVDSQLIRETALRHEQQGVSERQSAEMSFRLDTLNSLTADLHAAGISDIDSYRQEMEANPREAMAHTKRMFKDPDFRRLWSSYLDTEAKVKVDSYLSGHSEQAPPEVMRELSDVTEDEIDASLEAGLNQALTPEEKAKPEIARKYWDIKQLIDEKENLRNQMAKMTKPLNPEEVNLALERHSWRDLALIAKHSLKLVTDGAYRKQWQKLETVRGKLKDARKEVTALEKKIVR